MIDLKKCCFQGCSEPAKPGTESHPLCVRHDDIIEQMCQNTHEFFKRYEK